MAIGFTISATILVCSSLLVCSFSRFTLAQVLVGTAVPVLEWFNGFELSKNIVVHSVGTLVFFIGYLLMFFYLELDGTKSTSVTEWCCHYFIALSTQAAALLFVLFMYPTLVLFGVALYKLRDDQWKTRSAQLTDVV